MNIRPFEPLCVCDLIIIGLMEALRCRFVAGTNGEFVSQSLARSLHRQHSGRHGSGTLEPPGRAVFSGVFGCHILRKRISDGSPVTSHWIFSP